ncbi:MAG: 16S rRNA (cytosine(1402)-N(4))-methyltransferase RsmH [Armatimonadetes bacterium]|nr:16S rRNA (cytosine(1402)-N(4))-methyltransferase RsmH [Armatimonadota bacterium]
MSTPPEPHVPVMLAETLAWLAPAPGKVIVDATVGAGGHAAALLSAVGPTGRVVGIDRDPEALSLAEARLRAVCDERRWPSPYPFALARGDFRHLRAVLAQLGVERAAGVLFDLGASSMQLDRVERGFTFRADAPLDMRMDPDEPTTAAHLVNTLPEAELAALLRDYGEERHARAIARAIVARRPLRTTRQLMEICARVYPPRERREEKIHPATRAFQALRIAVNRELEALPPALADAVDLLATGGRVVVLAYHSLEDRIVKREFQYLAGRCRCPKELPACICGARPRLRILTPKPVLPAPEEVRANPRARSARLRAAEKLGDEGTEGQTENQARRMSAAPPTLPRHPPQRVLGRTHRGAHRAVPSA